MSSIDHPSGGPAAQTTRSAPDPGHTDTAGPEAQIALDQRFDADALFSLRSAVAAHASDLGAGRAVNDAVLVAHELSSNAVRHGGGAGRLRLWRAGARLYCEISDAGQGMNDPSHAGTSRPLPSVPGGRGLWIARQLAEISIDTGPDGTTITAVLSLTDDES